MDNPFAIGPKPTPEQIEWLRDKDCGRIVGFKDKPLHEYDWTYFRPWGVIPIDFGMHQIVNATLYAWHHGSEDYYDHMLEHKLGVNGASKMADTFLMETEGTAMLSSVSTKTVIVGKRSNLHYWEKKHIRSFGLEIRYLEDRGW